MSKSTSILLNDDFDAFIGWQVAEGHFNNSSEVIEAGLRLLKDRDDELEALRAALIEGEESGEAGPFDFDAFLAMKSARRAKGA